ncbi:MAG TPA: hypothetical protein VFL57_06425 [Bryobacteraceae bacterium]|nr:hypothetical protein [Bryobacteraceae bacterium]
MVLLASALAAPFAARTAKRPLEPLSPGIKISLQIPAKFTDEDLSFAKQLGVEYVSIPSAGGRYEILSSHKQRVEAAGLRVANIGIRAFWKMHFRNVSAPVPNFVETFVNNREPDRRSRAADGGRKSHRPDLLDR